jgi:hypothetical protein
MERDIILTLMDVLEGGFSNVFYQDRSLIMAFGGVDRDDISGPGPEKLILRSRLQQDNRQSLEEFPLYALPKVNKGRWVKVDAVNRIQNDLNF